MNAGTEKQAAGTGRARWVAAGFLGAFAASVLTVIWTGLMVEGRPADFDVGFRSVTLQAGETRSVTLVFDSPGVFPGAELHVTLPAMLERAESAAGADTVDVVPGENAIAISVHALAPGQGYLEAQLVAGEPIALERVFITVTGE